MLTKAIQQGFAAMVSPLCTMRDSGDIINQQLAISMANSTLSAVPFEKGHTGQFAQLVGEPSFMTPAFFAWNRSRANVALGYTPESNIPRHTRADITNKNIPPVIAMITPDYSYLLVNSEITQSAQRRLGLALPAHIVHDDKHPLTRVYQSPITGDSFAINFQDLLLKSGLKITGNPDPEAKLDATVDVLEPSVRTKNCLQNLNIKYIGELVQRTEAELLKSANFGRRSLNEVKTLLEDRGLALNMDVGDWKSPR